MDILNRTARALQTFLAGFPQASNDMRAGMEYSIRFLAIVLKNTEYHNLHLLMQQHQQEFTTEKYKLGREAQRLRHELSNTREQLAKARRELVEARAQGGQRQAPRRPAGNSQRPAQPAGNHRRPQ